MGLKSLYVQKKGMMQIFQDNGDCLPVTVLEVKKTIVTDLRTKERDGYEAVQIGIEYLKKKNVKKPQLKDFEKKNIPVCVKLREVKNTLNDDLKIGNIIGIENFKEEEFIDAIGISKGKGFAGNVKRHNSGRGPMSHGSKHHRAPGAVGACAWPGKIFKGQPMPGQMGAARKTVQNLKIVKIFPEKNVILVKGAVPGPKNSILLIRQAKKKK